MQCVTRHLLVAVLVLTSGCSTVIFRSDFQGVSNGPFSTSSSGTYADFSSPSGDEVLGSSLHVDSARFVNSVNSQDGLALLLAPTPANIANNPVISFKPVSAPSGDKKRTFFWQGRKVGNMTLNCELRNYKNSQNYDTLVTLRFSSGKAFLVAGSSAFEIGSLGNGVTHDVFVTIEPTPTGADATITPHGGGSKISLQGIYPGSFISTINIRVVCSYSGDGAPASDNYLFDRMIFRSR